MENKDGSKRSVSNSTSQGNSGSKRAKGDLSSSSSSNNNNNNINNREEVVKEAVASVIVNERSKYETKIRESSKRLSKYTAENDRLLDEVSNLRLQMREMKNDRAELVSAHHESMSLLAQVSEEKLVEFKSKSEQEAMESKAAQEEALRTVLEMMEKDCEDRVAELDNELARVESERERAAELQLEAAAKAAAEEQNKSEMEQTAKLAVQKLVEERATRDLEIQTLAERENQLKHELEMTKQRSEMDKRAVKAAHTTDATGNQLGSSVGSTSFNESYDDGSSYTDSRAGSSSRASSSEMGGDESLQHSEMSSLIHDLGGNESLDVIGSSTGGSTTVPSVSSSTTGQVQPQQQQQQQQEPKRPPVINHRSIQKYSASPFLNDPLYEMTRGRKLALKLQQFPWYQPRNSNHWDSQGLGLQSAWAYFEHSVLPRYIVKNADGSMPVPRSQKSSSSRVSVYESSDVGSSDNNDDVVSKGDSDIDDWLYTPKPKRPTKSSSSKKGQGFRQKGDLDRAEPGESKLPTKLYSPFFTPLSQLGDFGIGVGLYFSSLRAVAFITLIAGLISIPNILYYASDKYSNSQPGVNFLLKGSAICTEQVWVPCPTCTLDEFDRAPSRIAGTVTATPDGGLQTLLFALKNTCDGATLDIGIVNMSTLGFILLAIAILSIYQRKKQIEFDEQEQTAQDYSIEISNPPGDATEPEEWKEFFESRFSGHVTCCTVTIDNDLLVKALAERREVVFEIEEKIKEGVSFNTMTLAELAAKIEHHRSLAERIKSRVSPGIPELVGRLTVLNARIQGLAQQRYRATHVFCTFETEGAQRQVLSKMMVGSMASMRNNSHKLNPNLLFRGEQVLHVREAEEPSTIRWADLDEVWSTKVKQISVTTLISLACMVAVAVIVTLCRQQSAAYAALAISIANAMFPIVAMSLTNCEAHASETGKQSSLYVKIAVFRWVVTAIVITIITPFTSTITNGPEHLLQSIYVIFFADLITTNILQLVDPASNFKRHILAPRAASQERMNLLMSGTDYTIAERYTNMTKTLFLTFYYCAIYPGAFFLCALSLFVNFYVDKFSLMRTWKPAPILGPYIAKFSRIYFMTSAIAALAIVSSYLYSGFPFDNLCASDVSHSAYYGSWKVTNGEGQDSAALVEPGMRSYHFCDQFLGIGSSFAFPPLPDAQSAGSEWMTDEQEQLTGIYGWVSVGVLGLVGLVFLYRILRSLQDLFIASYKVSGVYGILQSLHCL